MLKQLAGTALAVSLALLATPSAAVAADTTTDPAKAAAGWVAAHLAGTEHDHIDESQFGAYGLTLDTVLSLVASGAGKSTVDKMMVYISDKTRLDAQAGTGADAAHAARPGTYAKLVLAASAHGDDVSSLNGTDVLAKLLSLQNPDGHFVGKPTDVGSVFDQALVVLALSRTPAGAPAKAVTYLMTAQCDDGSFSYDWTKKTGCGDPDHTSLALQALLSAGEQTGSAKALTFLLSQQNADGGFGYGTSNAASTGLAALALKTGGKDTEAGKASAYIKSIQIGCAGPVDQQGAIPNDSTGYDEATVWYATVQGLWALELVPFAKIDVKGMTAEAPRLKCEAAPPADGGSLPKTGTQIWVFVAIGLALILAGAGIVLAGRRKA